MRNLKPRVPWPVETEETHPSSGKNLPGDERTLRIPYKVAKNSVEEQLYSSEKAWQVCVTVFFLLSSSPTN